MTDRMELKPIKADVHVTVGIPTYNRSRWLGEAIESVLGQSHKDFTLIVSDNASTDDTGRVVANFDDPRIEYERAERNIGMTGNFNRLLQLARTDFVMLLCDDDTLHPDHLSMTTGALRQHPTAGAAHTGWQIVDSDGHVVNPQIGVTDSTLSHVFQPRTGFLYQSMEEVPVCFSTTMFRRTAILGAGCHREAEVPLSDFSLMMRIARDWDLVYINRVLASVRIHPGTESTAINSFSAGGFRWKRSYPDMLYERRLGFLSEANLNGSVANHLRRKAEAAYRRDRIRYLSMRASTGDGFRLTMLALLEEMQVDKRLARDPSTWRFVAGQLGGRRARDAVMRLVESVRPTLR
jgi:glycosyltransferase involved in cell wall biosynthesis